MGGRSMFMITCTFEKGFTDNLRHVVVHALVVRDNEILLEKRAGDLNESGKWAIPGGFLSLDETTAEGVLRELYEETGAKDFTLDFISIYTVTTDKKADGGYLFYADIKELSVLPESEIAEVFLFEPVCCQIVITSSYGAIFVNCYMLIDF